PQCPQIQCGAEIQACFNHVVDAPAGPQTCGDLNNCINECGQNQICQQACRAAADPDAVVAYDTALNCVIGADCFDDEGNFDQACGDANCSAELEACFGAPPPPPAGNLTCGELNDCLSACNTQESCDACFAAASPEGAALFQDASNCIQQQCANNPDPLCPQAQCEAEITACFDQVAPPAAGPQTCPEINDCLAQ
ncbi:MAG: hypothetical protein KC620_27080, partial [Myxococcales bacterium]|nr:hypothetical protein [Myxococcales bacterium]